MSDTTFHDAESGEFVTPEYAAQNPAATFARTDSVAAQNAAFAACFEYEDRHVLWEMQRVLALCDDFRHKRTLERALKARLAELEKAQASRTPPAKRPRGGLSYRSG
jgi:hypothetical protein